jgi:hypothetical protein
MSIAIGIVFGVIGGLIGSFLSAALFNWQTNNYNRKLKRMHRRDAG